MRAYGWLGSENSQLSERGLLVTGSQALEDIRVTQEHTSKMQVPKPHLQRLRFIEAEIVFTWESAF